MLRIITVLLLAVAALPGCDDGKIPVSIVGYNHTDRYIHSFTVNGGGGGNAFVHSGGGSHVCCVVVPAQWRPGLNARIRWMNEDDSWNETVVEVPQYPPTNIGDFNVHFLANGKVKVFVFNGSLGFPNYPLQGKEAEL